MHSQKTNRSQTPNKSITPSKYTIKKATINLVLEDFQHTPISKSITQKSWNISDFDIINLIGRGKIGCVYAAKEKQTDYTVAIKKMSKIQVRKNDFKEQIKREIIIQGSLHHTNILKLFGYFWDNEYVYLIIEYAPQGELYSILQKYKQIPEDQVSVIIRQVCTGLNYLHENSIIHRDIKPQNILLCGQNVKIGDFGWSIQSRKRRQTLCGTLDYLAPQIVKGQTHDSTIDIWQLGILTYELAIGKPPFQTQSTQQTYQKIVHHKVQFPNNISQQLKHFVKKLLKKDPNKRISCSQILKEPFITKYQHCQLNLNNIYN